MTMTIKELKEAIEYADDDTPLLVTFWNSADSLKHNGTTPVIGLGVFGRIAEEGGPFLTLNVVETINADDWRERKPQDLPRKA